jgi:hypothetical protein
MMDVSDAGLSIDVDTEPVEEPVEHHRLARGQSAVPQVKRTESHTAAARDLPAGSADKLTGLHGRCPFLHGTVRADPYPGYVQGRHPAICKYGCTPATREALESESPKDRLLREALEFNHLYHSEMGLSEAAYEERKEEISRQIAQTGRYEHTFDELQHGARVAWRNAGKCINRQVHMEVAQDAPLAHGP